MPKGCKELLVGMMQKNPNKRFTAIDTLQNGWLSNEETTRSKKEIMRNSAQNMAHFGVVVLLLSSRTVWKQLSTLTAFRSC